MAAWLAAAAVVQLYGQHKANKERAKAEKLNQREYLEQKKLSEMAARREADIFQTESMSFIGDQISALAKSGVQMDSSSLMAIAKSQSAADREYSAIKAGAAAKAKLFDMRANQAKSNARLFSSSSYNNVQALGTLLNVGADYARFATSRTASSSSYERQDYSGAESGGFSGPYDSGLFGRIGG